MPALAPWPVSWEPPLSFTHHAWTHGAGGSWRGRLVVGPTQAPCPILRVQRPGPTWEGPPPTRERGGPLRMLSVGSSPGSMLLRCCLSIFPKQAICPQKGSNGKRYKYSKWWKQEVERKRCSYSQKTDCHFSSVNTYSARFQKQACLNLQNSLPARGTLRRAAPRAVPGSWGVSATAAGPLPRKSY